MKAGGALVFLILRHALRGMVQRKVVRTLQIDLLLLQPVRIFFFFKKIKKKMKEKRNRLVTVIIACRRGIFRNIPKKVGILLVLFVGGKKTILDDSWCFWKLAEKKRI
jgi:hypothetical protein